MTFASPIYLWLLLPAVPALAAFFIWVWRRRQEVMTQFISARLLPLLTAGFSPRLHIARLLLVGTAVLFTLIALARPQWGMNWSEAKQRGLDILVAIDTSRSMLATDVQPNRLQRAKLEALGLMSQARNDRLGIVAFAGGAFLQCPLTLDDEAFRQNLAALDTEIIPQGGTAIAAAIETAVAAFKAEGENIKVLILFTDGEDHEEGAVAAAKAAAEQGMRIFTIGVGSPDGEMLRVPDGQGKLVFLNDADGHAVKSRLNEPLLRDIAAAGGGFYLNLRGADTTGVLYERGLSMLPRAEFSARLIKQRRERFHWPLLFAMLALIVEMFLPGRLKPHPPAAPAMGAARPAAAAVVALLLLLPAPASASPSSARRAYDAGDYQGALTEYDRLLQPNPRDPGLNYNAGNAAFQAGLFGRAAEHFSAALTAPELTAQRHAYYNLGNALYRQGEGTSDLNEKRKLWERALQSYDTTTQLDANDADAKFNFEFVKKKLEELQKQQEQQQQQQQQQDQKKDEQQKQQQSQKDQSEQKNDQQKKDEQKSQEKKQAEQKKKDGEKKSEPQQAQDKAQPKSGGKDKGKEPELDPSRVQFSQMTPKQAAQMLDAHRSEDRVLVFGPVKLTNQPNDRVLKNW